MTTSLLLALLMGLRHATDPDHLTAVSTLLLAERDDGPRRAALLGWAWGLGHASTLCALGIPFILFSLELPDRFQIAAEALIGVLIVVLAARLLIRWWRGYFHMHAHRHGSVSHAHPHVHEHSGGPGRHPEVHRHTHGEELGRSTLASYGLGLVHGVGGSAGVGVLLMASASTRVEGLAALVAFAAATAGSMAVMSLLFAYVLGRPSVRRRVAELVPVFAAAGLIFGVWYSVGVLQG